MEGASEKEFLLVTKPEPAAQAQEVVRVGFVDN
jgi:hypothetical protein